MGCDTAVEICKLQPCATTNEVNLGNIMLSKTIKNDINFRPMQMLYQGYKDKQGNNEQNSVQRSPQRGKEGVIGQVEAPRRLQRQ